MLQLFGKGVKPPKPGQRVVYVGGAFDLFHAGHIEALKLAKQNGDYLLVGVHNDAVINSRKGTNHPIMNLNERVLSVLGCKLVDDAVIDAPYVITREMMAALKIDTVVHEITLDEYGSSDQDSEEPFETEAYAEPRRQGKYVRIRSPLADSISTRRIIDRIKKSEERFAKKVDKKQNEEKEYYDNRYGFNQDETEAK